MRRKDRRELSGYIQFCIKDHTHFYGVMSNLATELYQLMKLVVADADDVVDVLFDRQVGVLHHSHISDNVDWFRNYGTDREGSCVIG